MLSLEGNYRKVIIDSLKIILNISRNWDLPPLFLIVSGFVVAFTHHVQISKVFSRHVSTAYIASVYECM